MSDRPRLIEVAFPLKQASIDSVHEKNVRHGHISTLHIWPARRPLAASRAALIATLLPDPGTPEKRSEIVERLAGSLVERIDRKKMPSGSVVERKKEESVGGILHWGRASGPDLEWFREEVHKACGGRAPRVLDPFAGGGAIPLEAVRLGCETTAIDINPVAWFILKCTLEYPQKLAGQKRPLPEFVLRDRDFMEAFFKAQGCEGTLLRTQLEKLGLGENPEPLLAGITPDSLHLDAGFAWHVRAWGLWVLQHARRELASYYPTYADFEPLKKTGRQWERRPRTIVPIKEDGRHDLYALNGKFSEDYLRDETNPRWVPKPTVAYLWARTVNCKNCRAPIPLLKTLWLCKKDNKRVLLTMEPNPERTGVIFGVEKDVPVVGGNAAQRREHDKRIGRGTMSKNGAWCPCCGKAGTVAMEMKDIQQEGIDGHLGEMMTAMVLDGPNGKEYVAAQQSDRHVALLAECQSLDSLSGLSRVAIDSALFPASTRSISCHLYGVRKYRDLFTPRQIVALGAIARGIHLAAKQIENSGYPSPWLKAIVSFLALGFDRFLSFCCVNVRWKVDAEAVVDAFSRFSISLLWDFAESQPIGHSAGSWQLCYERIATALDTYEEYSWDNVATVLQQSATKRCDKGKYDVVITDPPYYQAISYADLSDFFYVWLRGVYPWETSEFSPALTPKDPEIVQHIRKDKDRIAEKAKYEQGMFEAFRSSNNSLAAGGRFVCVFAHKDPEAWEILVSAMIRAGFVVTASWPIQTEMQSRQRASGSASLSSSVWLVSRKRSEEAKPGWDTVVLEEMGNRITARLRDFWDAGIRGPDFVWAATGPALEAYSSHPVVKKANEPGQVMQVHEFLGHVRRMVVNFVVGQVLTHGEDSQAASGLDDITAYYLLHRNDFGLEDAPIGACILYAVSCGLSDSALADEYEILLRTGGIESDDEEEAQTTWAEDESEAEEGTGSKVKLRPWNQRKRRSMGYTEDGKPAPLIDQIHRLMHLWKAGDQHRVDEYIETTGVRGNQLFHRVLQSLVELSAVGSEERSILETISNHLAIRGAAVQTADQAVQPKLFERETEQVESEKE
jgi:putative DNA methylase